MIQYEQFAFATPPGTSAKWFLLSCEYFGLSYEKNNETAFEPPPDGFEGLVVTLIRNPVEWLKSIFFWDKGEIGHPEFDVFWNFAQKFGDFGDFVEEYTARPEFKNQLFKLLTSYKPSAVMREEDLPQAFQMWLMACRKPVTCKIDTSSLIGVDRRVVVSPMRKSLILRNESEYCNRYEYY